MVELSSIMLLSLIICTYRTDEQGCNPLWLNEYMNTPLHCAAAGRGHCKVSYHGEALWLKL